MKVGDEVQIQLELVAPILPGKYCAFFRFVHGDNQRFGQKVWCDVLVEEVEDEKVKVSIENVHQQLQQMQEEVSSLLDQSEQRQSSLLANSEKVLAEEEIIAENIVEEQKVEEEVQQQQE